MDPFKCFLGGGSSRKIVQDPSELPLPQPSDSSDSSGQTDSSETTEEEDSSSGITFEWREIVDGTENFDITHLVGNGKTYRCDFPRIDKVGAVKIRNHDYSYGVPDVLAEATMLHAADHENVIKLLGKSFGHQKSALVYEFMPNGSLDHHLFAHARRCQGLTQPTRVLDWDTRMRIAVGVAKSLAYVHTELSAIHRNVKVENILLDDNFEPKLIGFEYCAKIVYNENNSEVQRMCVTKGAEGYVAPGTEEFGLVSTKSDVYSYGVFLLVLFTGRKAYGPLLTDWLMPIWARFEYEQFAVDVALGKKYSAEGLIRIFHIARLCINIQPLERPDMNAVETMVRGAAFYFDLEEFEEPPMTRRHSV